MGSTEIKNLTESNFAQTVGEENSSAVVEFYADWCKPCQKFASTFSKAAEQYSNIGFYRVNADEEFLLAATFKAVILPTVIYIKNGVVKDVTEGNISDTEFSERIEKLL
jgi:thioredoxin 1